MDFPLPPVGEGLFEVELLRWLVKPGDAVARGESLLEVVSDKATMEVPSPFAGTVTETLGTPGEKLKVADVVLRYQTAGEPRASFTHRVSPRIASRLWLWATMCRWRSRRPTSEHARTLPSEGALPSTFPRRCHLPGRR